MLRSSRWRAGAILGAGALIVICLTMATLPGERAQAGHSESFVFPGAPFSGTWNLGNFAPPSSHHRPWGGHWSVDYYQYPDVQALLWMASNHGAPQAVVTSVGSSCSSSEDWAGWAYKFNLNNSGGTRGWILYAHVAEFGPPNYFEEYYLQTGQVMNTGGLLGWTAFWGAGYGVGGCYVVNYANSNHFHVEMGQSIGSGHYSCYYNYPSNRWLYAQDWLGIAGANNTTSAPDPC